MFVFSMHIKSVGNVVLIKLTATRSSIRIVLKEPAARSGRRKDVVGSVEMNTGKVESLPEETTMDRRKSRKAIASKLYREQKKSEEWLEKERERCRNYRATMSDEQRERTREKGRERARRFRERKREKAGKLAVSNKIKKVSSPSTAREKAKRLREYKTQKQREYRARMSGNKKRAIRDKDLRYRANKRQELAAIKQKMEEKRQLRKASGCVQTLHKRPLQNILKS